MLVVPNGVDGLGLLGAPPRRAIFELLARRPSTVGELAQQLPITRSAVSQHLRVLQDGGLVISTAEGTRPLYPHTPAAPPTAVPPSPPTWTASGPRPSPALPRPPRRPPSTLNRRVYEHPHHPTTHRNHHRRCARRASLPHLHRRLRQLVAGRVPHRPGRHAHGHPGTARRRPLVRTRQRRQRVRVGPGAGLGAAPSARRHLADQRPMAVRPRPRARQRDRGPLHRRRT